MITKVGIRHSWVLGMENYSKSVFKAAEKRNILVVEGQALVRRAIMAELKRGGFSVEGADSCRMAQMQTDKCTPDLVIVNSDVGEESGFDIVRNFLLWPSLRGIPIMMTSESHATHQILLAMSMGIVEYITLPFASGEILKRVRKFFRLTTTG